MQIRCWKLGGDIFGNLYFPEVIKDMNIAKYWSKIIHSKSVILLENKEKKNRKYGY